MKSEDGPKVENEPRVSASSGGRPVTLDPVMDRGPLRVIPRRVENTMAAGFRVEWISGTGASEDSEVDGFSLTCGAGVGGRYLILDIAMKDGTARSEIIDMAKMLEDWVKAAVAAGPSPSNEEDGEQ